jgi:hypothetical protein
VRQSQRVVVPSHGRHAHCAIRGTPSPVDVVRRAAPGAALRGVGGSGRASRKLYQPSLVIAIVPVTMRYREVAPGPANYPSTIRLKASA